MKLISQKTVTCKKPVRCMNCLQPIEGYDDWYPEFAARQGITVTEEELR